MLPRHFIERGRVPSRTGGFGATKEGSQKSRIRGSAWYRSKESVGVSRADHCPHSITTCQSWSIPRERQASRSRRLYGRNVYRGGAWWFRDRTLDAATSIHLLDALEARDPPRPSRVRSPTPICRWVTVATCETLNAQSAEIREQWQTRRTIRAAGIAGISEIPSSVRRVAEEMVDEVGESRYSGMHMSRSQATSRSTR